MIDTYNIIIFSLFLLGLFIVALYFRQQYKYKHKLYILEEINKNALAHLMICIELYIQDTNSDPKEFLDKLNEQSKELLNKGDFKIYDN